MPRYEKDGRAIETSLIREGAMLRAEGWTESKARTKDVKAADQERESETPAVEVKAPTAEAKPSPKSSK